VYVGQTGNLERRLNQHFNGEGSEWTKKYRPQDVIEVSKSYNSLAEAKEAEREQYLKMKHEYGSERVRGAGYTTAYENSRRRRR